MVSVLAFQIGAASVAALLFLIHFLRRRRSLPLPPGPRPLPFLGNINDLPPPGRAEYLHWLKFKDTYGPLSSVTVLGQPMIIIHDRTAAEILLEKSSLKTSGRPTQPFADECGLSQLLPCRQYNAESKRHRKFIHQQLGTLKAATAFNHIQDVESKRLLFRTLTDPENLMAHFKKEASAIILNITYGYSPEPHGVDPLLKMIEEMMENFSKAFVPLSWGIDIIPQLRYLPEGFPGTGYKKVARAWEQVTRGVYDVPYSLVERQMAAGTNRQSYVSSLIDKLSSSNADGKLSREDRDIIKQTAATLYGGAADTTISTFSSFILAMLRFPDVQRKAQKEIDDVVGTRRLPGFEDRERLPYVDALVKESLRWIPVVPVGTAHAVEEEIIYDGFCIPKGSYILPSIWWFLHDPEVYAEPSVFDPERFLRSPKEPDPEDHAFGYGRRICPGRYLGTESLYITMSRLLAAFDISRAVDDQGRELDVPVEVLPGLIAHPTPYPYVIKARSAAHADLIRMVEVDHPWEMSDAKLLDVEMVGG